MILPLFTVASSCLLMTCKAAPSGSVWGYYGSSGPGHWGDMYKTCRGSAQSPVDFADAVLVKDPKLDSHPFSFAHFDFVNGIQWTISNNGHTVQVTYTSGKPVIRAGLPNPYVVQQFHFHWGSDDSTGSEHTVNGKHYPMEMHIVTYNSVYGNLANATMHPDGLAVLGVFFQVSETDNSNFDDIIKALLTVALPGSSSTMHPVPLRTLLPSDINEFYRYTGSLTTPPCSEIVTWTVFKEPVSISARQMKKFRQLMSVEVDANGSPLPLGDNFRPTQPLKGREINTVV